MIQAHSEKMSILDDGETWVSARELIFVRNKKYYFFNGQGWNEEGPFDSEDECRMKREAFLETNDYIWE